MCRSAEVARITLPPTLPDYGDWEDLAGTTWVVCLEDTGKCSSRKWVPRGSTPAASTRLVVERHHGFKAGMAFDVSTRSPLASPDAARRYIEHVCTTSRTAHAHACARASRTISRPRSASNSRYRNIRKSAEPISADRKRSREPIRPCSSSSCVRSYELAIAQQRLDARPHVAGRHARTQLPTRFERGRRVLPFLPQHVASTENGAPRRVTLLRHHFFSTLHPCFEGFDQLRRRPERRRNRERELDSGRHWTGVAKEVSRSRRVKRPSRHQCRRAVHAGPVMHSVDQTILHWICGRVDHLLDDRIPGHQLDHRCLLRCPQVLPTTTQAILRTREQLVKVLEEFWVATIRIVDYRMIVIRHRAHHQHDDVEPTRRLRQAIEERIVCLVVRAQQKHALRAATRDQVEAAWKHLSGKGHRLRHLKFRATSWGRGFNGFDYTMSGYRRTSPVLGQIPDKFALGVVVASDRFGDAQLHLPVYLT